MVSTASVTKKTTNPASNGNGVDGRKNTDFWLQRRLCGSWFQRQRRGKKKNGSWSQRRFLTYFGYNGGGEKNYGTSFQIATVKNQYLVQSVKVMKKIYSTVTVWRNKNQMVTAKKRKNSTIVVKKKEFNGDGDEEIKNNSTMMAVTA